MALVFEVESIRERSLVHLADGNLVFYNIYNFLETVEYFTQLNEILHL